MDDGVGGSRGDGGMGKKGGKANCEQDIKLMKYLINNIKRS